MFRFLALAFIVVPLAEVGLLFWVGGIVGGWETFSLMILISLVGAWMVKREGLGIIVKLQGRLAGGELPTKELVDGLLIALAGALLLTPGFITDGVGLMLLFLPTRITVRTGLIRRYGSRIQVVTSGEDW